MTVTFQNDGLIDLRAVTTFGVNAKGITNPIGFFGTGLKYAIAIILRNGGSFTLWRGKERYDFTLQTEIIRGEEFSTIFMNGERLGFTSILGKSWEPWQALRELESNTRDEMGRSVAKELPPEEDKTTICVSGFEAFEDAYRNLDSVFIATKPIVESKDLEVHRGRGFFFYRGIRVGMTTSESTYNYNLLLQQTLTEDRTLKEKFHAEHAVRRFIVEQCEDVPFLEEWLCSAQTTFEGKLDLDYTFTPSDAFILTVDRLTNSKRPFNRSAADLAKKHRTSFQEFKEISLTTIQEKQLEKSLAFLSIVFDFERGKYPIKVVDSIYGAAYGLARDSTIYLSREAFQHGTKIVAGTILEEYIHLDTGYPDTTRKMQEHLLNLCVTLGEQLSGEPL